MTDRVIVEVMPEWARSSHRAAGNWGQYPLNGATRYVAEREDAEAECESDPDEYARIVRDERPGDLEQYGLLP